MNKVDFIYSLKAELAGYDEKEIVKAVAFYSEMIEDRIEDGMSEEEAVESLGSIENIASEIKEQMPLAAVIQHKVNESKNRFQNKTLWLVLVICGFPIWFPLLAAAFVVFVALLVSMWAIIISLIAVVFAFAISGICTFLAGIAYCFIKNPPFGVCIIGAGIVLIGLFVLTLMPMISLCKKAAIFTGFLFKKIFITSKKEEV